MVPDRPNPDELLARVRLEESRAGGANGSPRGRLKIFFGMSPGVGKTYAMLAAAQRLAAQGVDVAVGLVETHGRAETEQLLLGLDLVPRRPIEYRASETSAPVTLQEFDCEAAIARRPDILLIDELAHTNAPGSVRSKRWQDVEECLRARINVYTTLNVQHLESINDIVAQITGVQVRETVPDSVVDNADELELVDVAPEVLHERLKAGKVYLAENAARAVDPDDGFFRKGNLTALRELALRRTAAWVDSEMHRYKQDRGIRAVWPAGERIIVAVSPSPMSGKLVRAAKRMAAGLRAELIAVYVETPRTANLGVPERERLMQNFQLAESLGATTATLNGPNAARELISFARSRNASKIVVGKTERPRWREVFFGSFINNLIRESGDIDIHVVRGDDLPAVESAGIESSAHRHGERRRARNAARSYLWSLGAVALVTVFGRAAFANLELANTAMIYLAAVVAVALWLGRGPAVCAAVVGVAAFDFFFVPPHLTFAVSDLQYVVTLAVMTAVGLIIGELASRSREQAETARVRERRTASLHALSRELAAAVDAQQAAGVAARSVRDTLGADVVVAVPIRHSRASSLDVLASAGDPDWFDQRERSVAQWSLDHLKPAGLGTQKLPASTGRYVPLMGTSGAVGLLAMRPSSGSDFFDAESLLLLEGLASQIASAFERITLAEREHAAKVDAERERLRSALLSSVSHDLRTPLAAITGAASTLDHAGATLETATRAALLRSIVTESARLNDIIGNLVFATRLEAGGVTLRREWTTVEEVIGAGLSRHREALQSRPFKVRLPDDLPMIRVDNAMLPQVVHNLVENALRYTAPGTPMSIDAWATDTQVVVKVADEGTGLAESEMAKVFDRFYRGHAGSTGGLRARNSEAGLGLGLTICDGIIRTHGGRIWAERNTPHGAAFIFSLPIERPQPSMPVEVDREASKPAAGVEGEAAA